MIKLEVDGRCESKAQRVYKIFKPSEVIEDEPFGFVLTFRNIGEKFYGGSFNFVVQDILERISKTLSLIRIPPIEKGQSIVLAIPNLMLHRGVFGMEFHNQSYCDSENTILNEPFLYDEEDKPLGTTAFFKLTVASKEEIYQKYSLVVGLIALTISITALLIATADLLVQIFR